MKKIPPYIYKLIPISLLGVLVGHHFVYSWVFGDASHRHNELEATGHGYLSATTTAVLVISVISICLYIYSGYKQGVRRSLSYWRALAILFVVQCLAFVLMEVSERFASGGFGAASELFSSVVLPLGIIFQLLSAAIVAALVTVAYAVGSFVAGRQVAVRLMCCKAIICMVRKYGSRYSFVFSTRAPPIFLSF